MRRMFCLAIRRKVIGLDLVPQLNNELEIPPNLTFMQGTGVSAAHACPIDLRESEDQQQYILEANVAGFKPEEIQITSSGDTVTIHAAKKEETRTEKAGYVRRERYTGEMSRTVTLPTHINADKIQATCDQGVLTLNIPKAEGAKTKQIPIKAKGH
jgi:HSP20 family protein